MTVTHCFCGGGKEMARTKRSITPVAYQIRVTLKGSKPPIWRRIQVTSATTLAQLHHIVQCVMGWEGYHLYRFEVGGMEYGDPRMLEPTFKGSECPCRFLGLRALHTTRSRDPGRHRPAGDGVGHQRSARPLAPRSTIGPGLLV